MISCPATLLSMPQLTGIQDTSSLICCILNLYYRTATFRLTFIGLSFTLYACLISHISYRICIAVCPYPPPTILISVNIHSLHSGLVFECDRLGPVGWIGARMSYSSVSVEPDRGMLGATCAA